MKSPYYYHITIGSSPKIHRNCQVRSPRWNVLRTLPRGNVMAPERFDQRHAAAAAAEAEGLLVGPPALENMCFLRKKRGNFR